MYVCMYECMYLSIYIYLYIYIEIAAEADHEAGERCLPLRGRLQGRPHGFDPRFCRQYSATPAGLPSVTARDLFFFITLTPRVE